MRHQQPPPQQQQQPSSDKQREIDDIWRQVRQLQNQAAAQAREYQDVKASHKEVTGPQETAAERYQHRQVQNDFDKIRKMAAKINNSTDTIVYKESEAACASLEAGVQHLATEKERLEARLKEINSQMEGMQNDFEIQLQKLDEQRRAMKKMDEV